MRTNPSSNILLKLLASKHSKDVFIPECKDGPTQGTTHFRLDAWAMARSWSTPTTWGYEIKVTRNDFVRDEKWHNYLDYCSDFYFVCPHGLIQPDELPPEVGLLWASKNNARLFMKKKAVRRAIEIPESLFRYIVMCRAKFHGEREEVDYNAEYWKNFILKKRENIVLGSQISARIRRHVRDVENENREIKDENAALSYLKDRLEEMGCDTHKPIRTYEIRNKLAELFNELPPGFARQIHNVHSGLSLLKDLIESTG